MQILFYERYQRSTFHIHAFSRAKCVYIPDLSVIIGQEVTGSFQADRPFITHDTKMLAEADAIYNTKPMPQIAQGIVAPEISHIDRREANGPNLVELVANLRERERLENVVYIGVGALVKMFE